MRTRIRRLACTIFALFVMSFSGQELRAGGGGECTFECVNKCQEELEGNSMCDHECLEVIGEPNPYQCEPHWTCSDPNKQYLEKCVDDT